MIQRGDHKTKCIPTRNSYLLFPFLYFIEKKQQRTDDLRLTEKWNMQSVKCHYLTSMVMLLSEVVLANAEPEPMVERADANDGHYTIRVVAILALIASILLVRAPVGDHLQMRRGNIPANAHQAESGWKYLHADVFRPPCYAALLAALVGSGAHLIAMICGTLVAFLKFLSPHFPFLSICNVFCASAVGGYTCSHLLKYFNVQKKWNVYVFPWLPCTIAFLFFVSVFPREGPLHSSTDHEAIAWLCIFMWIFIWFMIAVPSTFGGADLFFNEQPFVNPVSIGTVRAIPAQPYYL
ncbi:endomembrane protein 70, putative, partial [Bodo saltans]